MTDDLYHRQLESMATTNLVDMLRERDKRIEKLEKALSVCNASNSFNKEQLTKAKEFILKLSTCLEGHSNNNFEYELLQEAEQFLKETEQ